MASSGNMLLLLLVLYPLVVSVGTNSQPSSSSNLGPEWNRQKINKPKEGAKAVGKYLLSNVVSTLPFAIPFLGVIYPQGTLIAASANLAMLPLTALDKKINDKQLLQAITYEFESLHSKLDNYHQEQKFDTWASSVYSKPEKHINLAWEDYKTMMKSIMHARTENERNRHRDQFLSTYGKYLSAIKELNRLLTVKGTSFTYSLGDLLQKHIKCHELDLFKYTDFINKLIYKGIMMNQFYYRVKRIESKPRVDEDSKIAYTSAKVMFEIHKQCIVDSMKYVTQDVANLIDNVKDRTALAKKIQTFLVNTYGRYDWMVVAFITKNSKHRIVETLNKHVLAGFTEVTRAAVTVAVARQVKGSHTKVAAVSKAIEDCVPSNTICYKVREVLEKCSRKVPIMSGEPLPVAKTYSAVHAYTRRAHAGDDAQEVVDDGGSTQTAFIYRGSCHKSPGVKKGKFVVLIKSDEELMRKNPCANVNCGAPHRGKCTPIPEIFLAVCECYQPFFGKNCKGDLYKYQKELARQAGSI